MAKFLSDNADVLRMNTITYPCLQHLP